MTAPSELLRRYLVQRAELGETELILDRLDPRGLRALLAPSSGAARAPAVEAPPAVVLPPIQLESLDDLRVVATGCTACRLCETRTTVVFGEGNPHADLLVVGEAPGADEDRTGRPFVGRAGKLLDLLLAAVGFARAEVYICNVLKCRPPGNRNPQADEVEQCSPYLLRQVELVKPRVIAACGTFAAQTLLATTTPIGRLRGTVHDFHGVPLIPTYHPAALLRNPAWIRPVWEDLQRLRTLLDAA
jgi:uracil-DNA glycosylase